MQLSCNCRAAIVQLSCNYRATIMQPSCNYRATIVQLSCNYRAAVVQLSCNCRAAVVQLSCSHANAFCASFRNFASFHSSLQRWRASLNSRCARQVFLGLWPCLVSFPSLCLFACCDVKSKLMFFVCPFSIRHLQTVWLWLLFRWSIFVVLICFFQWCRYQTHNMTNIIFLLLQKPLCGRRRFY